MYKVLLPIDYIGLIFNLTSSYVLRPQDIHELLSLISRNLIWIALKFGIQFFLYGRAAF